MKNLKIIIKSGIAIFAATVLALALTGTTYADGNNIFDINKRYPIEDLPVSNPCNGFNPIIMDGEIHVTGKVVEDKTGTKHAIGHINAHLSGLDSNGLLYIGTAKTNFVTKDWVDIPTSLDVEVNANLISQGSTDNAVLKITLSVTQNGMSVENIELDTCRG